MILLAIVWRSQYIQFASVARTTKQADSAARHLRLTKCICFGGGGGGRLESGTIGGGGGDGGWNGEGIKSTVVGVSNIKYLK